MGHQHFYRLLGALDGGGIFVRPRRGGPVRPRADPVVRSFPPDTDVAVAPGGLHSAAIAADTEIGIESALGAKRRRDGAGRLEPEYAEPVGIETALALPDEGELEGVEVEVAPYDYSGVRQSIKTEGVLFKSISVRPGFFPILFTSPMSEEIGEAYLNEARIFFNRRPALKVNHKALFEDADGAVAISMFRRFDRNAYYLLNEMRKVINDNARRLMLTFSVLLLAATGLVFAAPVEAYQKLAGCVVVMVLMAVAQTFGYKNQQQHAIRELRSFLTRYLGRISDRFREVTGNARGVTVGDETDSQMLSTSAIKWHKVMMWLPFRTFFIETFVRNVLYQIDRNSGYYFYIFVPALAVCVAIVGYSISEGLFTPPTRDTLVEHYPLLGYLGVIIFYFHYITKVVIADELDQADWLGFDDLNVSAAMDEVVGKYAEDVGFWKGRFDR